MDTSLPVGLQIALYLVAAAILAFVAVAIPVLLRLGRQMDAVVGAIEELRAETKPLARETRELVASLRGLAGQADRIAGRVGSVVGPPLAASSLGMRVVRTGVTTFVRTLWNGRRGSETQARWV